MLYIKHQSTLVTSDVVRAASGVFGDVQSVVLRMDWAGRPFALVGFGDAHAASAAIHSCHGLVFSGLTGAVPLYVTHAMPRAARQTWHPDAARPQAVHTI